MHAVAGERRLPESGAGDAPRPSFELEEQPRSIAHWPPRFYWVGMRAAPMVYELLSSGRYL